MSKNTGVLKVVLIKYYTLPETVKQIIDFFLHTKNSLQVHKNGKSFSTMLPRKHDFTGVHIG